MKTFTRHFVKVTFFLFCICTFASCKHEEGILSGAIYGTITDKTSGDPVRSAGVELMPLGLKTITGVEYNEAISSYYFCAFATNSAGKTAYGGIYKVKQNAPVNGGGKAVSQSY